MKKTSPDKKTTPLRKEEDIQRNPDNKIDQDFPGYPHAPSKKSMIKPETPREKKLARVHEKDGEKK